MVPAPAPGAAALITVKVDTKDVERIAGEIAESDAVDDVFVVLGDTDIMVRASFPTTDDLRRFVVGTLGSLAGVKETKTLMVVATYKKGGERTS